MIGKGSEMIIKNNYIFRKVIFSSISLFAAAVMPPGYALAQDLHESVEVDGTFMRDVIKPERISILPAIMDVKPSGGVLNYEEQAIPAQFSPSAPAIPVMVWGAQRDYIPAKGYINLSLGSWLNSNLSAGFNPISRSGEYLALRLQHNSTSLWQPWKNSKFLHDNLPDNLAKNISGKRYSYQEAIGVDYSRLFAGKGLLAISAQYHIGCFNYYGMMPFSPLASSSGFNNQQERKMPSQTLNDFAFRAEWSSEKLASPNIYSDKKGIGWSAAAGVRHFAYRTATRETDIILSGKVTSRVGEHSRAGLDARGDILLYGNHAGATVYPGGAIADTPDNYGALFLTPYYEYRKNSLMMRIGVNLDFTFNASGYNPCTHYGVLHAAPDVRFDVIGKKASFYLHLLGGQKLQTLAATSGVDPYRNPALESTLPVYSPIDANIGVSATPFAGFEGRLNLRYKATRYAPMDGWYSALLNYGETPMPGLELPANATPAYGLSGERYNLSGIGVDLHMAYSPADIFRIAASGSYTPQRLTSGIFNGLDRPRWILDAKAMVKPIKSLLLTLGYEYRGVRNIVTSYITATTRVGSGSSAIGGNGNANQPGNGSNAADADKAPDCAKLRLPDITRLYFDARWDITSKIALSFRADNLLNSRVEYLPCLPGEGITFMGGVAIRF